MVDYKVLQNVFTFLSICLVKIKKIVKIHLALDIAHPIKALEKLNLRVLVTASPVKESL